MILKNSVLDAYTVLIGSGMTHLGMLVGLLGFLLYPSDIPDESDYRSDAEWIYGLALAVHISGTVIHFGNMFKKFEQSRTSQILQVVTILFNIYLITISLDLYTRLHEESILNSHFLDPEFDD